MSTDVTPIRRDIKCDFYFVNEWGDVGTAIYGVYFVVVGAAIALTIGVVTLWSWYERPQDSQ
jgi:hypothetical protein